MKKPYHIYMYRKILYIILILPFFFTGTSLMAQVDSLSQGKPDGILYPSDSIPMVTLDSIYILPKLRFANYKELKHFRWIRRKVYKVYPFAKMSGDNFVKLEERLNRMPSNRQKKRYIRIVQRWIKKEFEPQLKELTQTEGQILSKLLHRQTGQTAFELLKKYRSGWTAFWYQNLAKLYNIDLKKKFDPMHNKEDYWIEYILQQAFQDEILDPQPNKLGYDFMDLQNKWKGKLPHRRHIPANRPLIIKKPKITKTK